MSSKKEVSNTSVQQVNSAKSLAATSDKLVSANSARSAWFDADILSVTNNLVAVTAKQLAEVSEEQVKHLTARAVSRYVTAPEPSPLREKWGEALNDGFVQIPVALLRHQKALKLSNGEMVVLMNLLAAWWGSDTRPFLQTASIAKRMDSDIRSVQRHISGLERKGFIRRERSKEHSSGKHSAGVSYDLSGTVELLKEYGRISYRMRTQGET